MRAVLFSIALALGLAIAIPAPASALEVSSSAIASSTVVAADDFQPDLKLDVDVNRSDNRWYANPVWIAIGGVALLALVLLIVMAMRGGGTTVVKE